MRVKVTFANIIQSFFDNTKGRLIKLKKNWKKNWKKNKKIMKFNNETLRVAIKEWFKDATEAEATYRRYI